MPPDIRRLLALIDSAYDRRSWHGTNLRGSIRGLTARQAAWRPAAARHNIQELVVHCAYWKYIALRRLTLGQAQGHPERSRGVTGGQRGSFPLKGSNWFARPERRRGARGGASDARVWRDDVALLDRMHRALREAVAALSARDLDRTPPGGTVSTFALLSGVAAHDLYHAGQIQLLKRLQR